MKKLIFAFFFSATLLLTCAGFTSCHQTPSAQSTEVRTLAILGTTAKAGMDTAAKLLAQGQITVPQFQKVATFYDSRWQPAFNLAKDAAHADLSTVASPDLGKLANELADLVAQLTTKPVTL